MGSQQDFERHVAAQHAWADQYLPEGTMFSVRPVENEG